VNQTLTETAAGPQLSPIVLKSVTEELEAMHFEPVATSPNVVTFRDGERFVRFELVENILTIRVGVGSHEDEDLGITSMRLDEMIAFLYGGLQRGCNAVDDRGLTACVDAAMKDLKEFAHEFLRGDFRPFLRVLATKKREDRELELANQKSGKAYVA
jgi:hypothetical protein